jgi:hypothetical protein
MRPTSAILLPLVILLGFGHAQAGPYSKAAGKNAPRMQVERQVQGDDGAVHTVIVEEPAAPDRWGNASGNQNDLAVDGAFDGQTVAVLQLYTEPVFDFQLPKAALREKGFSVYRWINTPPSPATLEKALEHASQLWIISGPTRQLTPAHVAVIKKYFEAGHGLYIWGDNEPYYADANAVTEALFGTVMLGNVEGQQTIGLAARPGAPGLLPNHLLTTGLEHIYEGHTIATIQANTILTPLIYGSADNLVTAYYDQGGRRAIVDGGFTRLYMKWDTAGTARYVKNAAAWLVNAERFGDAVVGDAIKHVPAAIASSEPRPPTAPPTMAPTAADPFIATRTIGLLFVAVMTLLIGLHYVPALHRHE